jgi:hypothetical protein
VTKQQVESDDHGCAIKDAGVQLIGIRLAIRPADDNLAVNGCRLDPQIIKSADNTRISLCSVVPAAREQAHAVANAARQRADIALSCFN